MSGQFTFRNTFLVKTIIWLSYLLVFSSVHGQSDLPDIPVLCYHNIKNQLTKATAYTISTQNFESHISRLCEEGYQSVSPEDIFNYYTKGKKLPPRSVMISFDDTRWEHYHIAKPILEKNSFKGVFFIMTVSIGKPGYMTSAEIKKLYDDGHAVELHTYDHQDMRKLQGKDWDIQVDKACRLSKKSQVNGPGIWLIPLVHGMKMQSEKLSHEG